MEAITAISGTHGVRVGVFGHAGDGNFHPTFVMERDDPDAEERSTRSAAELFARVLELGGTICGEHGTGVAKAGLPGGASEATTTVRAMRAIKTALDPLGILNPGKVFPD